MIQLLYRHGQEQVHNLLEACQWILQQNTFTGLLLPHYRDSSSEDWQKRLSIPVASMHYFTSSEGHVEPPYLALQTYAAKLASKKDDQEGRALLVLDNPVLGSDTYLNSSMMAMLLTMLADSGSAVVIDQSSLVDQEYSLASLVECHSNLYIASLI